MTVEAMSPEQLDESIRLIERKYLRPSGVIDLFAMSMDRELYSTWLSIRIRLRKLAKEAMVEAS
jgi:hypothetical protein